MHAQPQIIFFFHNGCATSAHLLYNRSRTARLASPPRHGASTQTCRRRVCWSCSMHPPMHNIIMALRQTPERANGRTKQKNETLLQTYSAILMRKNRPHFIMERPATGLHPVSLEVEEKHLLPLSYCNVMQHSCEKRLFVRSATISMKICCRNCKSVFTMPHSLCKTTSET